MHKEQTEKIVAGESGAAAVPLDESKWTTKRKTSDSPPTGEERPQLLATLRTKLSELPNDQSKRVWIDRQITTATDKSSLAIPVLKAHRRLIDSPLSRSVQALVAVAERVYESLPVMLGDDAQAQETLVHRIKTQLKACATKPDDETIAPRPLQEGDRRFTAREYTDALQHASLLSS